MPGVFKILKLNEQQALTRLNMKFWWETQQIFDKLHEFRDGEMAMEVYM